MVTLATAEASLIIFGIGLLVFVLIITVKRILTTRIKGMSKAIVKALYAPLMVTVGLVTAYAIATTAFPEYLTVEEMYLTVVCLLLGTWAVYRIVIFLIDHTMPSSKLATKKIMPLAKFAAKILIWAVGLFMILSTLKVDISPLLASAGVLGIAAALAAQDLLGNIFGGIVLYTDNPFCEGDWVYLSDTYGYVLHVGLRSTRIMTEDNQVMTIPNSSISNNVIVNYSKPNEALRMRENVSVAYGSDVALVKQSLREAIATAAEKSADVSTEIETEVGFMEFGDSALIFEIAFGATSTLRRRDAKDAVNSEIDRIFHERGIEIPFPQRVVTMKMEQ